MWKSLFIPEDILKAIEELDFKEPTPIQWQVIPLALRNRADILGSAPTGSGKTLAFGVPVLVRVREAKLRFATKIQSSLALGSQETQTSPKLSKKAKKRVRSASLSGLHANSSRGEMKRRKVMEELALIEELDPDTMDVVKVHDLSKKSAVMHSEESFNGAVPSDGGVLGLVILPTRELALQVTTHLRALAKHMTPPGVTIEAIVGGISVQKQERILRQRRPDILVATPGRLWEFIQQENETLVSMPQTLSAVVFDEADRLVESQHFVELRSILQFLKNKPADLKRQTFVFSATLTFVHSNALMPGTHSNKHIKKFATGKKMDVHAKLGFLRDMLGLAARAKVVDLSSSAPPELIGKIGASDNAPEAPKNTVCLPSGLSEYRLSCPNQVDKDVLLVWLLLAARVVNSGRALIFLNSKSGARRLAGVLRQCGEISPHLCVLHADMLQKQRLRSLERFQASNAAVIVATDVAARGLDFASCEVAWVVHFDVPRTTEIYIHRCGRTARANRSGRSVVMLAPGDVLRWRKLARNLHHLSEDGDALHLPELKPTATTEEVAEFRSIVRLMREMDEIEHGASKKAADREWFLRTAREADIDLDSDLGLSSDDDNDGGNRKRVKKTAKKTVVSLRRELNAMLASWRQRLERNTKHPQKALFGRRLCVFTPNDLLELK
uniref:ATP-dependent RNA helicase n=1 Tax=Echinococcus granulosus TaxID=6210 RepID=A0A068WT82_ECHGR|nr:DEAD box ATP dependent RNA helicase 13 [Echinococcus granulosus]